MNEWTRFNGTMGMMMCSEPCQMGNEAPPWQRSPAPA